MVAQPPARLTIVQPDSREVTLVPGFTATVKLVGAETGGISIVEHTFARACLSRRTATAARMKFRA